MLRKTTIESQCQMKKDMDFFSAWGFFIWTDVSHKLHDISSIS